MTELSFIKEKGKYVARFQATDKFALQVEGVNGYVGVGINYRVNNGEFGLVEKSYGNGDMYVKTIGNGSEVYPVYVKVVCDSMPTYGGYAYGS